jgi:hypothetical protein
MSKRLYHGTFDWPKVYGGAPNSYTSTVTASLGPSLDASSRVHLKARKNDETSGKFIQEGDRSPTYHNLPNTPLEVLGWGRILSASQRTPVHSVEASSTPSFGVSQKEFNQSFGHLSSAARAALHPHLTARHYGGANGGRQSAGYRFKSASA